MTKFLLYTCRHGDETLLLPYDKKAFDWVLNVKMPMCNIATLEDLSEDGFDYDGSWEQGFFYIDDGGRIETIELIEDFDE